MRCYRWGFTSFIDFLRQILMLGGVVSFEGKDCKPFSLNVNNNQWLERTIVVNTTNSPQLL